MNINEAISVVEILGFNQVDSFESRRDFLSDYFGEAPKTLRSKEVVWRTPRAAGGRVSVTLSPKSNLVSIKGSAALIKSLGLSGASLSAKGEAGDITFRRLSQDKRALDLLKKRLKGHA